MQGARRPHVRYAAGSYKCTSVGEDVASGGTDVTSSLGQRAEALLRSVVGITAAEVRLSRSGGVDRVRVSIGDGLSSGQVVQNIRSALFAGLGVSVHATQVELVAAADWVAAAQAAPSQPPPAPAEAPKPAVTASGQVKGNGSNGHANGNGGSRPTPSNGATRPGNGNGSNDGNGSSAHAPAPASVLVAPQVSRRASPGGTGRTRDERLGSLAVEHVELIRHGGRIRCRVVLTAGVDRYSAIADARDEATAEIQLAGRVACDALRAGQLTAAQFDGATIAHLSGRAHVVVGITELMNGGRPEHRSGSAVVKDSLEYAAAVAVVQALRGEGV